jgi:hypothetical protein
METETSHRAGPIHQRSPTHTARASSRLGTSDRWDPRVGDTRQGKTDAADFGELQLIGDGYSDESKGTTVFPLTSHPS